MAWGGARPGAGRKAGADGKKPNPRKPRQVAEIKLRPTVPAEPKAAAPAAVDPRAWSAMLPEIEEISRRYAKSRPRTKDNNPFKLPEFPKLATPPQTLGGLAMDSALVETMDSAATEWLGGGLLPDGIMGEGLAFPGFNLLAELAQRGEYRVMSETIADDATRKWIDFDVVGDEKKQLEDRAKDPGGYDLRMADPDDRQKRIRAAGKTDRVKELKEDQERLNVKLHYYEQARNGGFFGRSHLFYDIRTGGGDMSAEELKSPIGDGRGEMSKSKVPQGSFRALKTVEPVWAYPLMYNSINPLSDEWYNPQVWFVMGQEIHCSRLPSFVPHPVPDILKPAYAFGGTSLTQLAKPYVDIWLQTKQSVGRLIHSFSVMVLMTDLSTLLSPNSAGSLLARVAMANMLRDNQNMFVVNKNSEDFKNISAPLGGLHELQAQAQEHIASINRIPLVKFTGIQPAGLNASSEGEIEVYDDTIGAYQARVLDPNLRRTINFEQYSLWGELDPEITHRWETLRPMTQEEKGKKEKEDMERDAGYVDLGAISPAEVRKRIINDKELPYTGLDPDDVPQLPEPGDGEGEGGDDEPGAGPKGPGRDEEHRGGAQDSDIFEEGDKLRDLIESLGRLPQSDENDRAIEAARARLIRVVASTPAPGFAEAEGEGEGGE